VKTVALGELVKFEPGYSFDSERFNTDGKGVPLVRIRDVKRGCSETWYEGDYDRRFLVEDGDFLIGMDGEFNLARWQGGTALLNQRVCRMGKPPPTADRSYIARFLNRALKAIEDRTAFATVKHLSTKTLDMIQIPLPPIEEQRRIAAILDKADELRAKRRAALAHLDSLPHALTRATKSTAGEDDTLGNHIEFMTSGARGWAKYYSGGGDRFIRSYDVGMNSIRDDDLAFVRPPDSAEARRISIQTGDILLTITGSKIGRIAVAPQALAGAFISQHVAILRLKPSSCPDFVALYMALPEGGQAQIARAQHGQSKPGLNFEHIHSFRLPRIGLSEQRRVTNEAASAAKSHRRCLAQLRMLDDLFASLQQRAFAGQL
jgi:type I restriction enzyme, S subunit